MINKSTLTAITLAQSVIGKAIICFDSNHPETSVISGKSSPEVIVTALFMVISVLKYFLNPRQSVPYE